MTLRATYSLAFSAGVTDGDCRPTRSLQHRTLRGAARPQDDRSAQATLGGEGPRRDVCVVDPIEARIAPVNNGGIYYTGPSEDWSRLGRMWWSVPDGIDTFAIWKEITTVYHEGAPGHHLQFSQTLAEQENLNRWQRLMCWVSGCGEGWAFYAERLMGELGYLDDPGAHLGMLDAQLMGAANVALDIGVHLELEIPAGTGWREGEARSSQSRRLPCVGNLEGARASLSRLPG